MGAGRFQLAAIFDRKTDVSTSNDDTLDVAIECPACHAALILSERQQLGGTEVDRLVETRCPECKGLIAEISTCTEIDVSLIH